MKKTLLLHVLLGLLATAVAAAQERRVTGRVTSSEDSQPLPGVSVIVTGTTLGTTTDATGTYSISVPAPDAKLTFSFIGYLREEVAVGSQTQINVSLMQDMSTLNEVVVTALGVERSKKALGYATQELKGKDLIDARTPNLINSLAGKVAGIVINQGTQGPGASSRVVLRGDRSLLGNSQPLYVVDGIPIDNTQPGQVGEFGGADLGDGIGNINPDDIESMSILRGATAAALYGSRAQNGVIMITTKKGAATKDLGISYGVSYSTESPMYDLDFQNQYAQGSNGQYLFNNENSWGPRITGQSVQDWNGKTYALASQDHVGSFLRQGNTLNNSLSINGGTEKTQLYFSATNLASNGLVPNNQLNRTTLNLRGTVNLSSKLTFDSKVTYLNQRIDNRPEGGEGPLNPYSNAIRMPSTVPDSELQNFELVANGRASQNFFVANSAIIANPYYIANRIKLREVRNRVIGLASATYKFTDNLSVLVRAGLDTYFDNDDRKVFSGAPLPLAGNSAGGDYRTVSRRVTEFNTDFLVTYNTKIGGGFALNLQGGGNLRRQVSNSSVQNAGGLDIPNFFNVTNGTNRVIGQGFTEKEVQSLYASGQFSFKEFLFLDLTARNDWSSTLPRSAWSYFYPSASLSAVLSEIIGLPQGVSYLKVRGSVAGVGNDTEPYRTVQYLSPSNGVVGTILTNEPTLTIGSRLRPERTRAFETGVEAKFFQNRFGFDFTYYRTNTFNQLATLPQSPTTGFTSQFLNLGNIQNQGIELLLNARPVAGDFAWDVSLNFTRNRNKVVELDPAGRITNYGLGGNRIANIGAINGQRMGEITTRGFQRDANGAILINPNNGLPLTAANVYVGNANPDWLAGLNNAFSYKGFRFEFLIDGRFGGKVVSHTQAVLAGLGRMDYTLDGREGNLLIAGVKAALNPNGTLQTQVEDITKNIPTTVANDRTTTAEAYWQNVGGRGAPVGEVFTYDATNIRLRQFTIGYRLPVSLLGKTPFRSANVSVYGRNLFFLLNRAPMDPEVALNTGLNGQGLDFYGLPSTRSLGVSLNVTL